MPERYNLVGKHKDDKKPIVITTYDKKADAEAAVQRAVDHDENGNWTFYVEICETKN